MASLYSSIFPYIYVQPHPLFRYKNIHTLGVSETQVLFWSVLGVILVEMHIYLALVISMEGGPVQGQIAFHEHVMCVPGSSAERYWPNLDPGTVLCLFSLQVDCHLPLCRPVQTELFVFGRQNSSWPQHASLRWTLVTRWKWVQWVVGTRLCIKWCFVCFSRCASIWAQQFQWCGSSPTLLIMGNSEYLITLL